jgi:hypothetical protein
MRPERGKTFLGLQVFPVQHLGQFRKLMIQQRTVQWAGDSRR